MLDDTLLPFRSIIRTIIDIFNASKLSNVLFKSSHTICLEMALFGTNINCKRLIQKKHWRNSNVLCKNAKNIAVSPVFVPLNAVKF